MYLSSFHVPIGWGAPERRGRSPGQRACFSEGHERIVCVPAKGEAANLRGKPKPGGLELPSAGAERGNYPEAKPKREGDERQTCMHNRKRFSLLAEDADALPSAYDRGCLSP